MPEAEDATVGVHVGVGLPAGPAGASRRNSDDDERLVTAKLLRTADE